MIIPQAAAAGLLAGDVHRQRIRLEPRASARLVSAGATMVYGAGAGDGGPSETAWRFEIGADARLVNRGEPYVLHGPARLRSTQTVILAETGRLLTWDSVVFSGDIDAAWTSEFVVESPDGAALLIDAQRAAPGALARQGGPTPRWRAFGARRRPDWRERHPASSRRPRRSQARWALAFASRPRLAASCASRFRT